MQHPLGHPTPWVRLVSATDNYFLFYMGAFDNIRYYRVICYNFISKSRKKRTVWHLKSDASGSLLRPANEIAYLKDNMPDVFAWVVENIKRDSPYARV